jgi:hypothetical protein
MRILVLVFLLVAASGRDRAVEWQPSADLEGFWGGRFAVTQPGERDGSPLTASVAGVLALVPVRAQARPPWLHQSGLEQVGVFHIDFRPFGFAADSSNFGPVAGGRVFQQDSVEISLQPGRSHGGVRMLGVLSGGAIRGSWYHNIPGGSIGTFVLERRSGSE